MHQSLNWCMANIRYLQEANCTPLIHAHNQTPAVCACASLHPVYCTPQNMCRHCTHPAACLTGLNALRGGDACASACLHLQFSWACGAQVVKETQSFQRVAVSRDEALAMFQENKFKVEIISNLPETATISLYRCTPPPKRHV